MLSTMRNLSKVIGSALLLLLPLGCSAGEMASPMAPTPTGSGADTVILGCNETLPDEIGIRELTGNIGDIIGVPVTVRGSAPIDAFGLDLEFPENLLELVDCEPGDLTGDWLALACQSNAPGSVTIGGFHTTAIPAGTFGQLAIVNFRVIASSDAGLSFTTSLFTNDISTFDACDDGNLPSPVSPATWGQIKASYRGGSLRSGT